MTNGTVDQTGMPSENGSQDGSNWYSLNLDEPNIEKMAHDVTQEFNGTLKL